MHCEACGARSEASLRCGRCRAMLASLWLLGLALLVWSGSIALFLVLSKIVYADIAKLYDGLGSQPPVLARVYFGFSQLAFPIVALAAIATPVLALILGKRRPPRLRTWSRRYALAACLGLAWALLGVAAWYLCVSSMIDALS